MAKIRGFRNINKNMILLFLRFYKMYNLVKWLEIVVFQNVLCTDLYHFA